MIKSIIITLRDRIKIRNFRKEWSSRNTHNNTKVQSFFNIEKVEVGKFSYGLLDIRSFGHPDEYLKIGNYVSISEGVVFILGGNHRSDTLSTFPLYSSFIANNAKMDALSKGAIMVEDNVWIGTNCIIMSGVTIGTGAIIAAGSIVTKNVPAYSIVGGNPARIIKYRLTENEIQEMNAIDFATIPKELIISNIDEFYKSPSETIHFLKNKL